MSDMESDLALGDVVQLDPAHCRFGPLLVVVTDIKSWGIEGYALTTLEDGTPAHAPMRSQHGRFVRIGKAAWLIARATREACADELAQLLQPCSTAPKPVEP